MLEYPVTGRSMKLLPVTGYFIISQKEAYKNAYENADEVIALKFKQQGLQ